MIWVLLAAGLAGAVAALATGPLSEALRARGVLDHPNARSSHAVATPRGGGIAVGAGIALAWAVLAAGGVAPSWPLAAGTLALAAVSWIDDVRGLGPLPRLAVQALAVGGGVATLDGTVFQGLLPPLLDRAAAAVVWLWFVNLFNFMDGIDGIAGTEAAAIGTGLFLVAAITGGATTAGALGLVVALAALGFLRWNWHPARVFLGDIGSVPLGYLLGWALLATAAAGHWAAAVILPLYYLADATLTLARRAAHRERLWEAHREHFYQRAVARGLSHATVAKAVALTDAVLLGAALASLAGPAAAAAALALAALSVAALLWYLGTARAGGG